jgi:putative beta-lysine N-acetyltransferase
MNDIFDKIGKSTIQHGKSNDRVYLMKIHPNDFPDIILAVEKLADEEDYAKIICKVPETYVPAFVASGYITEAVIPNFFKGVEDLFFMSRFRKPARAEFVNSQFIEFQDVLLKPAELSLTDLHGDYTIGRLMPDHADEMVDIFKKVFATYPFPVHDPVYLIDTMKEHIRYFGIWKDDKLLGISSAETDDDTQTAEMTDFAVLPDQRGKRLAIYLLKEMEGAMIEEGIKTLYTIARLKSPGMNRTFINLRYKYSGSLINNTDISGAIESMNVYYKQLIR